MNIAKMLQNFGDNLLLSHVKETETLVRLLAVAIFLNEDVTMDETDETYKILRVHFEKLGVSDDEISLIKKKLDEKVSDFKKDRMNFIDSKKTLLMSLKNNENKKYYLELMKKVFESDGLDETEKNFLKKSKKYE